MIDFNVPPYVGTEMDYVREAAEVNHKICGDGPFSRKCHAWMEERFNAEKVLLTTSGTDALEMAANLCGLEPGDERDPHAQEQYRDVAPDELPYTECLKDTIARAWPYFEDQIRPQMLAGKRVLIAAHGNSLRALVMKLEHLTPDEILKVNIPTGVPLVYTFDAGFNVLDKRYIGDPATIAAKIDAVANQGKAKK